MSNPAPRDKSSVVNADYEAINQIAVDQRTDAKYARQLAEKTKAGEDLTKPSNSKLLGVVAKAMKASAQTPAQTSAAQTKSSKKRKAGLGDELDDLSDVSEEKNAPKRVKTDPEMDKRTVVLTNLPHDTEPEDITTLIQSIAKPAKIHIPRRGKKCRGLAFVTYDSEEDAHSLATSDQPFTLRGNTLTLEMKGAPKKKSEPIQKTNWLKGEGDGKTVFAKGVFSGGSAVSDLVESVQICGKVANCGLTQNRKGAVIQFDDPSAVAKTVLLKGVKLNAAEVTFSESNIGYAQWAENKAKSQSKSTSWTKPQNSPQKTFQFKPRAVLNTKKEIPSEINPKKDEKELKPKEEGEKEVVKTAEPAESTTHNAEEGKEGASESGAKKAEAATVSPKKNASSGGFGGFKPRSVRK